MIPIIFMSAGLAQEYLKKNKRQKVLVLGERYGRFKQSWLSRVIQKPQHDFATFSLFTYPIACADGIYQALVSVLPSVDVDSRWFNQAACFIKDLLDAATAAAGDESISFGESLERIGFDLSYDSFLRCALGERGEAVAFHRTLRFLNITSRADAELALTQEHYQYITMQMSSLFQAHKERLSSHRLIHLNRDVLSRYDAVLVVCPDSRHTSYLWSQDSKILLSIALAQPGMNTDNGVFCFGSPLPASSK